MLIHTHELILQASEPLSRSNLGYDVHPSMSNHVIPQERGRTMESREQVKCQRDIQPFHY